MTYQSLARKYRPQKFEELVGQDSCAIALGNAIRLGREPHAIIFSGVRGIGKTTTARLYAKALNCVSGPTPEPCGTCDNCISIAEGRHPDVMEIDGASNTGVADVRALQETVEYVPQKSKFKVYIIDEVHMLSGAAFNALLKTLEEPPETVVFVFATTELHKVPATIVGRCQTFYLKKFDLPTLSARIKTILDSEKIEYEDGALHVIAREGRGSMRDALTLLDQIIALGGGKVTTDALNQIFSSLSSLPFIKILHAMASRNADEAIAGIDELDQAGIEFETIATQLATFARHGFIMRDLGPKAIDVGLLGLDSAESELLLSLGQSAQPFDLNRIFRTLVKCKEDLKGSSLDRFVVENYILEWCLDPGLPLEANTQTPAKKSTQTFSQMKKELQSKSNKGGHTPTNASPPSPPVSTEAAPVSKPNPAPQIAGATVKTPDEPEQPIWPDSWRQLVTIWRQKRPLKGQILEEVQVQDYSREHIALVVEEDSYASQKLMQKEVQEGLRRGLEEMFQFRGKLSVTLKNKLAQTDQSSLDDKIIDQRSQERQEREAKIREDAQNAECTQAAINTLGATIERVDII